MASMSVTIPVKYDSEWGDIRDEADRLEIPRTAKFRLHVDKGYDQMDPGSESIVFTWTR